MDACFDVLCVLRALAWQKVWTLLELYRELAQQQHRQHHLPFFLLQSHTNLYNLYSSGIRMSPNNRTEVGLPLRVQSRRADRYWDLFCCFRNLEYERRLESYALSEYLEGLFEIPVVVYEVFLPVALYPATQLEWIAAERDRRQRCTSAPFGSTVSYCSRLADMPSAWRIFC